MENTKELVVEFKGRINVEVRRQEKLDLAEEKNFRRGNYQENIWQECYIDKIMGSLKMNI